MLHWSALYYRNIDITEILIFIDICCITEMIWTVPCQEIEMVRFLGSFHLCLLLNYVNQTTKSNLSNSKCGISKTNFLTTRQLFSLIITKRVVLTLTLWCHVVIPKGQTYLNKPTTKSFYFKYVWHFATTGHERVKRSTVKEKSFCKFLFLTFFKETLIRN